MRILGEFVFPPPQKNKNFSPSSQNNHKFILDELYIVSWSTKMIQGQFDVAELFFITFMDHKRIVRSLDGRKIKFFR